MGSSVYSINKGVGRSIEFRGLKAQYIWYLGGGIVGLLILFVILYIIGVNTYICLGSILLLGTILFLWVYHLCARYGEHGLMKKFAMKRVPKHLKISSRKLFIVSIKK